MIPTESHPMDAPNRRRNKLANRRLQLRIIGVFAGMCALALLTQTLVLGTILMRTAVSLPAGGDYVLAALPEALGWSLAASLFAVVPALLLVGIQSTFRVLGPLRGMERHLKSVIAGEDVGPCKLREGDDLTEFARLIDGALDAAREQGAEEARRDASGESSKVA